MVTQRLNKKRLRALAVQKGYTTITKYNMVFVVEPNGRATQATEAFIKSLPYIIVTKSKEEETHSETQETNPQ